MKSSVEKSPICEIVLRPALRSLISGTEKLALFSVPRPPRALPDVDQALLVVVDERLEQHAADHAEDRRVGADAERERQDDGDGQAAGPEQRAKRVAKIGQQSHDLSIQR